MQRFGGYFTRSVVYIKILKRRICRGHFIHVIFMYADGVGVNFLTQMKFLILVLF